jgi:hypothetical protein
VFADDGIGSDDNILADMCIGMDNSRLVYRHIIQPFSFGAKVALRSASATS